MFLWVGRDAVPQLVLDVFDIPAYDKLRIGKVSLYLPHPPITTDASV